MSAAAPAPAPAAAGPVIYVGNFVEKGDELSTYNVCLRQKEFDRLSEKEKAGHFLLTSLGFSKVDVGIVYGLYTWERELEESDADLEEICYKWQALKAALDPYYNRIVAALRRKAAAPAPAASTAPPIYVGKFVDEGGDDDLAFYTICSSQATFDQLSAEEKSQFCTLTSLGISDADQATWRALHAREEEMADDDESLTEERLEERDALEEELDKMHILIVHALRRKAASA